LIFRKEELYYVHVIGSAIEDVMTFFMLLEMYIIIPYFYFISFFFDLFFGERKKRISKNKKF